MTKPVRVAVVGTGGIAGHHLSQLAELGTVRVEIVALCDVVETRAVEVAAEYGGRAFTDPHRMLDETNDLHALYVCVPPFAHGHGEVEIAAAQRGLHLFVEKPVVSELEVGQAILDAVRSAGVLSSIGYSLRYTPALQAARQLLAGQNISMICSDRWGGLPGDEDHWWRVYDKSGGQLHEQTTHQIDSMRWLAGEIAEVHARYGHQVSREIDNMTVPDAQVAILQFASGAVGYVSNSCILTQGGGMSNIQAVMHDARVEVGGREVTVWPEGALEAPPLPETENIDAAFIGAIADDQPHRILCDYEEGLKSAAVSIAANRSAETGRPGPCWTGA
ncbi:MAG: Gfo/Idh/MocA family oxidoreductase [Candidatus Latescibacterota bacterium]|nr:Gfo/Idh/MocA family oxidoreductase [Candidatus Latescibacterota bacterium]